MSDTQKGFLEDVSGCVEHHFVFNMICIKKFNDTGNYIEHDGNGDEFAV
jgi:hypothetical protein